MLILLVAVAIAVTQSGSSSKKGSGTTSAAAPATSSTAASTPTGANGIAMAPAFTADQLNAVPGTDWITNGGSLANDRYSSLDEINDGNVSKLKGAWMTPLNQSGVAQKYSAEGQPIV